jgi:hypothetical protein
MEMGHGILHYHYCTTRVFKRRVAMHFGASYEHYLIQLDFQIFFG